MIQKSKTKQNKKQKQKLILPKMSLVPCFVGVHHKQWHNRQGAECPPETSDREIFADVSGKKRQGKKGKEGKL